MAHPGDNADPHGAEPAAVRVPPGAPLWITPELIALTLQVWQPYYEQPLTAENALEILMGAGRMIDVLSDDGSSSVRHANATDKHQTEDNSPHSN